MPGTPSCIKELMSAPPPPAVREPASTRSSRLPRSLMRAGWAWVFVAGSDAQIYVV
jgi:hypothetical protein